MSLKPPFYGHMDDDDSIEPLPDTNSSKLTGRVMACMRYYPERRPDVLDLMRTIKWHRQESRTEPSITSNTEMGSYRQRNLTTRPVPPVQSRSTKSSSLPSTSRQKVPVPDPKNQCQSESAASSVSLKEYLESEHSSPHRQQNSSTEEWVRQQLVADGRATKDPYRTGPKNRSSWLEKGTGRAEKQTSLTPPRHSRQKIRVYIKTLSGGTITVEVDPFATIAQVKSVIEQQEGTPRNWMRLIFAGKILEDGKTLATYTITHQSTLHLVLSMRSTVVAEDAPGSSQLVIRTLTGEDIIVKYIPHNTILDVKGQIYSAKGIDPYKQRLIFAGRQLEDVYTLQQYTIGAGSTLHLVIRL